ncbi:hypothetical protein HanPI659440_Chr15g0613741 [Helianthus annuus]|nr:hypothetical protein HanPI659440_Chr15g0613741 [Helianthus annuus]
MPAIVQKHRTPTPLSETRHVYNPNEKYPEKTKPVKLRSSSSIKDPAIDLRKEKNTRSIMMLKVRLVVFGPKPKKKEQSIGPEIKEVKSRLENKSPLTLNP